MGSGCRSGCQQGRPKWSPHSQDQEPPVRARSSLTWVLESEARSEKEEAATLSPNRVPPEGCPNDQTGSRQHPEVAERMFVPATGAPVGPAPLKGSLCSPVPGAKPLVAPASPRLPHPKAGTPWPVPGRPLLRGRVGTTGAQAEEGLSAPGPPAGAALAANSCARLAGFSALCSQHSQPFLGTRGHS